MTITLGSLFDGSGGFPLAGVLCGIKPIWASEIEPYPIAVTKSRFPDMKHLGDISKVNGAKVKPVDIITFGSPCQDLSIAGKRAGLKHEVNGEQETTRSGLFMEAVRIIKEMRGATNEKYPRFAVWENVPGAFSSNKGEDYRIVLEELIKISETKATVPTAPKGGWPYADAYVGDGWSLAYRTFDAQYWGVPQRRRRIYLVADFAGGCAPGILFKREGVRGYFEKGESPWQGITANAERSIRTDDKERFTVNRSPVSLSDKASTLRADAGAPKHESDFVGRLILQPMAFAQNQRNEIRDLKDKAGALAANHGMKQQTYIVGKIVLDDQGGSQIGVRIDGKSPTLRAETHGNIPCVIDVSDCNTTQDFAAYSFNSLGSNSMKSKNLHSGYRQVDVAKTLDTTDTNPCKNQGGMAIVQPIVLFEPRSQDGVPRIHEEISPTLNTAQGGQRQPCIAVPVYCIQGNCIDRSDNAGCNGKGWQENTGFTLNTIDRPAVIIPQVFRQSSFSGYIEGEFGTLRASGGDLGGGSENLVVQYIVRRLTPIECARLQGFADDWGIPDHKEDLTDEEYHFWLDVRNTHAVINGRKEKEYTKAQMLTWYNKLHSKTSEYKMWGNGVALPPTLYCMQGIVDVLND